MGMKWEANGSRAVRGDLRLYHSCADVLSHGETQQFWDKSSFETELEKAKHNKIIKITTIKPTHAKKPTGRQLVSYFLPACQHLLVHSLGISDVFGLLSISMSEMEHDPMVLVPHVLCLPSVCGKTSQKNKRIWEKSEKWEYAETRKTVKRNQIIIV